MAKYTGNDLVLWAVTRTEAEVNAKTAATLDSDDAVAQITSVTFDVSRSEIDVSTISDKNDDFRAGSTNTTFTMDLMFDPEEAEHKVLQKDEYIQFECHPLGTTSGDPAYSGYALITGFSENYSRNTAVSASVTGRIVAGALTIGVQS